MAIAENGPGGRHRGRIGNIVYYMLGETNVARGVGITTKASTQAQLRQKLITKMRSELLRDLLDFVNTGFSIEAMQHSDNGFNRAVKNNPGIITGIYPDLEIAYDQVLLSKGRLNPAQNWKVNLVEAGLEYTWDTDPQMPWPQATDQVMLLAYFPQQQKVFYTLFGNSRLSGSDFLEIPPSLQDKYMETYMSFISADRKQLSDSIYTGSFNSDNKENKPLKS
ncbi:DUF6266 family protein [Pedobacter nutrimenti]|jgi:hypothetical protein|uniref:Uncharacterized protein n=1 Tax=Pedobacter nutrimenti TaxID=1241337 RepID=A0A318UF05_9SPHI|nr:DUF6266 family protein [Pedobacter nutrimenti]PYF74751.1 hypothetical protein B0O44_103197 [Pedobacter nutrimenti]